MQKLKVSCQLHEQDPIEFEEFLEREFPLTEEEEFKFAIPPKDKKSFTNFVSLGKKFTYIPAYNF